MDTTSTMQLYLLSPITLQKSQSEVLPTGDVAIGGGEAIDLSDGTARTWDLEIIGGADDGSGSLIVGSANSVTIDSGRGSHFRFRICKHYSNEPNSWRVALAAKGSGDAWL